MLDCWMAFDVEYTVRLAETLRPYRLKWIEECLIPEDFDAHVALRAAAALADPGDRRALVHARPVPVGGRHRVADILQPDINWCGGVTACRRIARRRRRGGHRASSCTRGGNTVFGQHFSFATARCRGGVLRRLRSGRAAGTGLAPPGQALPKDGWLIPNDAPGFGLEIDPGLDRAVLDQFGVNGRSGVVAHIDPLSAHQNLFWVLEAGEFVHAVIAGGHAYSCAVGAVLAG